jgi:putative N6-adenine-specific DNA methylase
MRETLAAGLLALAAWSPEMALHDPMCGAGTIPIEAGAQRLDLAPGLTRSFAMSSWPAMTTRPELAQAALDEARARAAASAPADAAAAPTTTPAAAGAASIATTIAATIVGSDRDPKVIASARRNAGRAGLAAHLTFLCADLADVRPSAKTGLVLLNPPYGRRLGDARHLQRTTRDLGRALRARFSGWRAGVLLPESTPPTALGLPVTARFPLTNGGLRVALLVCQIP